MKKSLFLLLFILLVCLLALPAAAETEEHPHTGNHCVCGGSAAGVQDHQCADITWRPLPTNTTNFTNLPSGNYYLTGDVTITAVSHLDQKQQITICLNGYDIHTTAGGVFGYIRAGAVVNICDCSGKQDSFGYWSWGGTVTANQTGGTRKYGGIAKVEANGTMCIYGGNFVGAQGATEGGAFVVCNDGYALVGAASNTDSSLYTSMTIYNGHIQGGSCVTDSGAINSWHNPTLSIYGGVIEGGTAPKKGNIDITSSTNFTMVNCLVTGGTPGTVLRMDANGYIAQYTTLADALKAVKSGEYLQLTGDMEEAVTVPAGVVLDLAGNDLSGVTVTEGAYFIDSTTDRYDGSRAGTLTPAGGSVTRNSKYSAKAYLAVCENGSYSFHRYYMAITKLTLKPKTVGMGYKATFVGSGELKASLSSNIAFGYSMWLDESQKITRGYTADKFTGQQELTLRIDNFLDKSATAQENEQRAHQTVYACTYLRLADGTYIESAPVGYNFRQMLELANKNYTACTTLQKSALQTLSATFSQSMISWDIHNIHHTNGSVWQVTTNTGFNNLLKNNSNKLPSGHYVLAGNVDIGSRTIIINPGRNVSICLNGYTITSSARLFKNYGNLTLCDCHADGAEGYFKSSYTVDADDTDAGEYAPIMYCYANSVTNLYGGNMAADNPVTFAGLIAVSHDNSDKTLPSAVFNMYGGALHGNNVIGSVGASKTASGGAVSIWNGGSFNLYGGTVYGGNATQGAAFIVASGCTMNIYGGTVTGGTTVDKKTSTYTAAGGNIVNSGTLNIYGGTIEGGTSTGGRGGNIYSTGPVNMYGGTVTGGTVTALTDENGETVYNYGFGGGIYMHNNSITVSGDAVIDGNGGYNLYLGYMSDTNIKNLGANAKIGIASQSHGAISDDPATISKIVSEESGYKLYTANGRVMLAKSQPISFQQKVTSFSAGYAIKSIHPTESGLKMSPWGSPTGRTTDGTSGYELHATTVALTDEANNTVLMITVDLQSMGGSFPVYFSRLISQATGVPADQIYISATHTHNCPSLSTAEPGNARYINLVADALVQCAMEAMADRAPATMQTGTFETQGMNYTRNYYYYLNDDTSTEPIYYGDQYGQFPQNGEKVYRVREGDTTMNLLAFERTGKQPILLVNWRAHPHRSGGMKKFSSDADVIGATREYMHNNTDYLFAYYQGAAGNMNTTSRISGETYKSGKIKEYGAELGRQIVQNGLIKLKPAETGLIQTDSIIYAGAINHDDEIYYENAQALLDFHKANPELMDTYQEQINEANKILEDGTRKYEGVYSVYHAQQIVARHNAGLTRDISMNVFSIGDSISFCTAPGEIWDRVSEQLAEESPYANNFFIGYCDGGIGYMPYGVAGNYPSYEYYSCVFKQDEVIIQMMNYYRQFMNQQYENAQ